MRSIRTFIFGLSIVSFVFLLASCFSINDKGKRTNEIIPGYFEGYNFNGEETNFEHEDYEYNIFCTLTVTEISETDFIGYNSINTIYDPVGKKYYYIKFTSKKEDEDIITYEFKNLKGTFDGDKYSPIVYYDDNDNRLISPFDSTYENTTYQVEIIENNKSIIRTILSWGNQ